MRVLRRGALVAGRACQPLRKAAARVVHPIDAIRFRTDPACIIDNPRKGSSHSIDRDAPLLRMGNESRSASTTGLVWLDDDTLISAHLLDSTVFLHSFERSTESTILLDTFIGLEGLEWPENIAVDPKQNFVAITNSLDGHVNFYALQRSMHQLSPTVLGSVKIDDDRNAHGVAISPSGKTLAYTTVDDPGWIRVAGLRGASGGSLELDEIQRLPNEFGPCKPKGIGISHDGRLAAVSYGLNAGRGLVRTQPGFVAIHRFDDEKGLSPRPLSVSSRWCRLRCPDDVKFLPDGHGVIVTDQARHAAKIIDVSPASGKLGGVRTHFRGPRARLSFPHGCAVSSDGKYAAISNYGDGSICIFALDRAECQPKGGWV